MESQIETLLSENEKLREQYEELKLCNYEKVIEDLNEQLKKEKMINANLRGQITKKVNERIFQEKNELQKKEKSLNEKQAILETYNINELISKKNELLNAYKEIEKKLPSVFEENKNKIIMELTEEFERFSDKDSNSDRTCGYLIGISKAKKIIKEKLVCSKEIFNILEKADTSYYLISKEYEKYRNLNILNK